jgi:hypothetical protein
MTLLMKREKNAGTRSSDGIRDADYDLDGLWHDFLLPFLQIYFSTSSRTLFIIYIYPYSDAIVMVHSSLHFHLVFVN